MAVDLRVGERVLDKLAHLLQLVRVRARGRARVRARVMARARVRC